VTPQDRPIETLREQTVDQLIMNYGHGKLSREAFERRLDEALDTKSHERLTELTEDLDLRTDRQYTAQKKAELGIRVDPSAREGVDEADTIVNVFAGHHRRGAWDVPRALRMINVFGGCELDFTDARFTAETTYIAVFCCLSVASTSEFATACARFRKRCAFSAASTTAAARHSTRTRR
jgi:hypothetical protein